MSMRIIPAQLKYYVPRLGLVWFSVYLTLLAFEIGLWLKPRPERIVPRGLIQPEKGAGYSLRPGFHGRFDDGIARGEIRINSLGCRDDEPRPDAKARVLLLGDSFTFGSLLDQAETIDKWVERLEPGLEVCNLGVGAYNLPQQLEPLRRWMLPAQYAIYLFFRNDLRTKSGADFTVIDGYLVRRRRLDGTLYSDSELRQEVAKRAQPHKPERFSLRALLLPRVRQVLKRAPAQLKGISDRDRGWLEDDTPNAAQRNQVITRALGYTQEMRALAVGRGMSFQIVIIPALEEVQAGTYQPATAQYVAGLRAAGFSLIELLPRLSAADYWQHDGHFNPQGAKAAAEAIYQALKEAK